MYTTLSPQMYCVRLSFPVNTKYLTRGNLSQQLEVTVKCCILEVEYMHAFAHFMLVLESSMSKSKTSCKMFEKGFHIHVPSPPSKKGSQYSFVLT